jgi:hypothetical protein
MLPSVVCPVLKHFYKLSHNSKISGKIIEHRLSFDSLQLMSEMYRVFMYSTSDSCDNLISLNFLENFSENNRILNLMKIRPLGAELFHADGQTDMMNLTVAFRDFGNPPKTVDGEILYRTAMKVRYDQLLY